MPKKSKKELIQCQYYRWKLGNRAGVYFADGRSGNRIDLGRHSLGTKNIDQARDALKTLDEQMAVKNGEISIADHSCQNVKKHLELVAGWNLFRDHVTRPRVLGGVKPESTKRYRAIFNKLITFLKTRQINYWQEVSTQQLNAYCSWLEHEGYAPRTQCLELTTVKQCLKWLVNERHLPTDFKVEISPKKPKGSNAYCWSPAQVTAMVSHCLSHQDLNWLAHVIIALATTGLRISELASLRWSDISNGLVNLTDESARTVARAKGNRRETKSGRSRSFPIHPDLEAVLTQLDRARDGLIFHGPLRGKLKPDTIRNILIRDVLKPLETRFPSGPDLIGFKDGRLHSFRHYFCSVCANSNVPELMVREWLGHADSEMVRHYFHLDQREAHRQMRQLQFIENAGSVVPPATCGSETAKAVERTAS